MSIKLKKKRIKQEKKTLISHNGTKSSLIIRLLAFAWKKNFLNLI